eukprot:7001785-Prymnesium_polylepis.1
MGEPVPADAMTLALCKLGDVAAVQAYLKKNPGMLNSKSEKVRTAASTWTRPTTADPFFFSCAAVFAERAAAPPGRRRLRAARGRQGAARAQRQLARLGQCTPDSLPRAAGCR